MKRNAFRRKKRFDYRLIPKSNKTRIETTQVEGGNIMVRCLIPKSNKTRIETDTKKIINIYRQNRLIPKSNKTRIETKPSSRFSRYLKKFNSEVQ